MSEHRSGAEERGSPASAAGPLLEVEGLTVRFGGVTALEGVGFSVAEGEVVALVGPNGAGKTSVLNCLSGVVRAQAGAARVRGRDVLGLRPHAVAALGVARTFQNLGLVADLSVEDNLLLGRHRHGRTGFLGAAFRPSRSRAEDDGHRARCRTVAERLGLTPHLAAPAGSLPYGVRKRVELGRALCAEPVLLLADEPASGLGAGEAADMAAALLALRRERGMAVLLVEHDQAVVEAAADRTVALDSGRVARSLSRDRRQAPATRQRTGPT
jgi:branched-chain amino acid transport system ATP-binding protein